MPDTPNVRPLQIWADNDPRSAGRTIRVDSIEGDKAICTVLTNSDDRQVAIDRGSSWVQDARGRVTRVSLSRFKPTKTGYRLLADTSEEG